MGSCPSNWWQAPVYFTVSVVLAFFAISTALHSLPRNSITQQINHPLLLNASKALRRSGFNFFATFLEISPQIFLSSPNITIFAIQDSVIFNTSLPPPFLKLLLQYHTSTLTLPFNDLLNKPHLRCFPTLHGHKNLAVTKVDTKQRLVEINHVLVSHPDIFLEPFFSIHGVDAPFSSLDPQDFHLGWDYIQPPTCVSNFSLVQSNNTTSVEWRRIIQVLSSKGFVSFAIGLHSGNLELERLKLKTATVFAPPDFAFIASSSPLLHKIVRLHILPRRFTYKELASLPDKALLNTLVTDHHLEIKGGVKFRQGLSINGIEILNPDVASSTNFVIHGISRSLEMTELPNASI